MAPMLASLATLILLLAIAHAAIYRTTITTISEEVKPAASNDKCEQEMLSHPINACHQFLKHGSSGTLLVQPAGNPREHVPQECCKQLQQVSKPCRCEMVKMTIGKMMQQEGGSTSMEECHGQCAEMMMRGAFLPSMCKAGPPCRFDLVGGDNY